MSQNIALPLTRQVEIRMIGQIEHGIFIRGCRILHSQGSATQGVAHGRGEVAWETLIPILAHVGEFDSIRNLFGRPYYLVEAADSTVKRIVAIILWSGIRVAIELEAAMSDAIRVTAD